jgi:Bacterial lectin
MKWRTLGVAVVAAVLLLMLAAPSFARADTVPSPGPSWVVNQGTSYQGSPYGGSAVIRGDGSILLTPSTGSQGGNAYYNTPIQASQLTAQFDLTVDMGGGCCGGAGGDGASFQLRDAGAQDNGSSGCCGETFGFDGWSGVAVAFGTFHNSAPCGDISDNYIGLADAPSGACMHWLAQSAAGTTFKGSTVHVEIDATWGLAPAGGIIVKVNGTQEAYFPNSLLNSGDLPTSFYVGFGAETAAAFERHLISNLNITYTPSGGSGGGGGSSPVPPTPFDTKVVWQGKMVGYSCEADSEEGEGKGAGAGYSSCVNDGLDAELIGHVRGVFTYNAGVLDYLNATSYQISTASANLYITDGWNNGHYLVPVVGFNILNNVDALSCIAGGVAQYGYPPWVPFPKANFGDNFLHDNWDPGVYHGGGFFSANPAGPDTAAYHQTSNPINITVADAELQLEPFALNYFGGDYTTIQSNWVAFDGGPDLPLPGACGSAAGPPPAADTFARSGRPASIARATPRPSRGVLHLGRLPRITIDGRPVPSGLMTRILRDVALGTHWRPTALRTERAAVARVVLDELIIREGAERPLLSRGLVRRRVAKIAEIYEHASPSVLAYFHFPSQESPFTYIMNQLNHYQRVFTVIAFREGITGRRASPARAARWLRSAVHRHHIIVTGVGGPYDLWKALLAANLLP